MMRERVRERGSNNQTYGRGASSDLREDARRGDFDGLISVWPIGAKIASSGWSNKGQHSSKNFDHGDSTNKTSDSGESQSFSQKRVKARPSVQGRRLYSDVIKKGHNSKQKIKKVCPSSIMVKNEAGGFSVQLVEDKEEVDTFWVENHLHLKVERKEPRLKFVSDKAKVQMVSRSEAVTEVAASYVKANGDKLEKVISGQMVKSAGLVRGALDKEKGRWVRKPKTRTLFHFRRPGGISIGRKKKGLLVGKGNNVEFSSDSSESESGEKDMGPFQKECSMGGQTDGLMKKVVAHCVGVIDDWRGPDNLKVDQAHWLSVDLFNSTTFSSDGSLVNREGPSPLLQRSPIAMEIPSKLGDLTNSSKEISEYLEQEEGEVSDSDDSSVREIERIQVNSSESQPGS
ncbi:hypothetical protein Q3G72_022157 [Acer saccharum]|nr:hypothetical protein Q3G72_022157 [Acer saccharum]